MRITPGFAIAAAVTAGAIMLAVRDDLKAKAAADSYPSAYYRHPDFDNAPIAPDPEPAPVAPIKQPVTAADLPALIGPAATPGPLLDGILLGVPGETMVPDLVRERINGYKERRHVNVEYDQDYVSLNEITIHALGNGVELRDAVIAAWGMPRRIDEDDVMWLGAGGARAQMHTMVDGIDLRFTRYMTIDDLVAPTDNTAKLGIEPMPLVGTPLAELEAVLGSRLQATTYDDEWSWSSPGVGNGIGTTRVTVKTDGPNAKITEARIEGGTDDARLVREALIAKWGPAKTADPDLGIDALEWKHGRITTTAIITDASFEIVRTK